MYDNNNTGNSTSSEGHVTIPLNQGEWDEALGLPISVVCHNVRISRLVFQNVVEPMLTYKFTGGQHRLFRKRTWLERRRL